LRPSYQSPGLRSSEHAKKQAVRPGWKRRASHALESGCTSTFLFRERCWEASCLSVWGGAARPFVCFVYAL
ncbi:unnamed protein product, partial [Ascophyllum nodosum]